MKFSIYLFLLVFVRSLRGQNENPDIPDYLKNDQVEYEKIQYPETDEVLPMYDFIIVGAGSAGCALANRLSEISDWKILLIEAGGHEKRYYDVPATANLLQQSKIDWGYITEPSKTAGLGLNNHSFAYPRGKVVGGSSVINFMIYTRGNPEDYNRWETIYKNHGWSFKNVEKYFKKLENYTIPDPEISGYFGKDGPLFVQEVPFHSEFSTALLKAAKQSGLALTDTNGPHQIGISRLATTTKDGYRFSANSAYLTPIREQRPNLHLKPNCQAKQILISHQLKQKPRAFGVQFSCSSSNYTTYAKKEVILSAGAINSPQLLMLSGIGPRKHLKNLNIPVIKDLPVGNNLMDHINAFGIEFLVDQPIFQPNEFGYYAVNRSGPLSIPGGIELIGFTQPTNDGIESVEQLFISAPLNKRSYEHLRLQNELYEKIFEPYTSKARFTVFSLLQKPRSRGYIRLRNRDPFTHPKIYANYLTNKHDVRVIINGIREAIRIAEQPALKEWNATLLPITKIPQCARHKYQSDDYWECIIRTLTFTLYHLSGTCKMGVRSDITAVVDPELKVHGIDSLRVVDASIMPEIIAGHLNGPTMMIAEKAADMIKDYWKR